MISSSSISNEWLADPDVQRMIRVSRDDAPAFRELVESYEGRLHSFLTHMLGSADMAEDLVQETFLRVYRARHRYEPRARFSTWIFHIAGNLARSRIKKMKRQVVQSLDAGETSSADRPIHRVADRSDLMPVRQIVSSELREQVQLALAELNDRQRMAVLLSRFEGMSYSDIGEALGVNEQAVKSLMFRAREKLRSALAGYVEREETA